MQALGGGLEQNPPGALHSCPGRNSGPTRSVGRVPAAPLMPGGPSSSDGVESITVVLAGLEITITARPLPGSGVSTSDYELVSSVGGLQPTLDELAPPSRSLELRDFPLSLEDSSIAAVTPAALAALPLDFLGHLVGQLRGADRLWTPRARIARGFRAGILGRRRLDGQYQEEVSPSIPFRNCFYVVLRARGGAPGFWTTNYGTYIRGVGGQSSTSDLCFPTQTKSEVV